MSELIEFADFEKVDIRTGVIIEVEAFPRAKKPSYKFTIDFGGDIGLRHSSGQYTHYTREALIGSQVIAVVNLPPRNIAGFMSECLILGVPTEDGKAALLSPTIPAQVGGKLF